MCITVKGRSFRMNLYRTFRNKKSDFVNFKLMNKKGVYMESLKMTFINL